MSEILFNNKGLCKKIHGIIQVGSHCGEEYDHIKENGWKNQIYFEPVKESFYRTVGYITVHRSNDEFQTFSNMALLNKSGNYIFHLGRNRGCSSFLQLNPDRPAEHQNNIFDNDILVGATTLDKFFEENPKLNNLNYNLLYLDTQGSELHVLVGATNSLKNIDVICLEISYWPIYLNSPTLDELEKFLNDQGFILLGHQPIPNNELQGDGIFIKKGFI